MGKSIEKTYTRNSNKELLVLREKIKGCLHKFMVENDYELHTSVGGADDLNKTLTISVLKRANDAQTGFQGLHAAIS